MPMPAFTRLRRPVRVSAVGRLIAVVAFSLFFSSQLFTLPVSASPRAEAPGGPGALSYFDLARKDCLGTARNTTSKVWFTLVDGVLSDVYYPTEDNTNVKTLQYIVTDGQTFTDLQTWAVCQEVCKSSGSG